MERNVDIVEAHGVACEISELEDYRGLPVPGASGLVDRVRAFVDFVLRG